MVTRESSRRARLRLDERLSDLQPATRFAVPRLGWVRAVREALGMSMADLGRRLGVTPQNVSALEASEQGGTAKLDTLRRAAAAMDCTLVYAFLPNTTLQQTVEAQARRVLAAETSAAMHSMALEDQAADLPDAAERALLDKVMNGGRLWGRL